MTIRRSTQALIAIVFMSAGLTAQHASISQARQLYNSTYYEEALNVLDEVVTDAATLSQRQIAREYRALCLIALNRASEAQKTIEQMLEADPFYRPADEMVPPGLVMAFERTRRQLGPSLVRERYNKAKMDFDAKRYAESADGFELMLRLIRETDVASGGPDSQPLKEIETLAARFLIESRAGRDLEAAPPAKTIYSTADPGVTPPVLIRQEIPPWRPDRLDVGPFEGQLEIVVDVDGTVRMARLTTPIHPAYNPTLLAAARKWKYRPASKDGRPIAFTETISIRLASQ